MRARLLGALEIVDAVQRVAGDFSHGPAEAFVGQQLAGGAGQRQGQRRATGAGGGGNGGAHGGTPGLAGEIRVLGTQAYQQDAFGADAVEVREQPGFAGLAAEIAALQQAGDLLATAQVEDLGFGCEFAVVVDTHGDAVDGKLGKALRPDFELHVLLSTKRRCFKVAECNSTPAGRVSLE
jgi:hypothetical protein